MEGEGCRMDGPRGRMRITKIFNNNIVAVLSPSREELIVTGAGVGFRKQPGDLLDVDRVEKTFEVVEDSRDRFFHLLSGTDPVFIALADEIRKKAMEELAIDMNVRGLIGLTDHIAYAVERKRNGVEIPNLMLHEIQSLYPEEYRVGLWGLERIDAETAARMSEHEAGYIAMHLVNAGLGDPKESIARIFQFTNGIVDIISEVFDRDLRTEEMALARLNSHLKFLAKRILQGNPHTLDAVEDFYDMFLAKDRRFKTVIRRTNGFLRRHFDYELSRQEAVYLMVHINKVVH